MRGAGLTKQMVMSLPSTGAAVIVHSWTMVRYVERMIFDLRGKDVFSACKVISVDSRSGLDRLCGLSVPTFIDHAYCFHVPVRLEAEVDAMVSRINARFFMPLEAA